jgi:hypothetical protein
MLATCCVAQAQDTALQASGQVQLMWDQRQDNPQGPLALANSLAAHTATLPASGATLEALLRLSGRGWSASASLQQSQAGQSDDQAWLNELVASHDAGRWQFSAGKKIVAWDVGYAFRPNDVVQQEQRRTLVARLPQGRPVLMVEHFNTDTAWSLVWVNPTHARTELASQEPALAARLYWRQGNADWHGFVRWGVHSQHSVGAALAWVATDALELHASARYLSHYDGLQADPTALASVLQQSPWRAATLGSTSQVLLGGTWTHESQFSVLAEAWWDGTALSGNQWAQWRWRNQWLGDLATMGAPGAAVAGNLAWQNDAWNASTNLQRSNLYLRLSWEHESWQPTLDWLYHPADAGRVMTAALLRKGERVQWQVGLRLNGGPRDALLMQLPTRQQAYLSAIWAY